MVGTGRNDTHLDAILWIPTGVAVKDVHALSHVHKVDGTLTIDVKYMLRAFDIDRAPPNVVPGIALINNAFVLGTSTRLLARATGQGTHGRDQRAVLILEGVFIQQGNSRIAMHNLGLDAGNAEKQVTQIFLLLV